MGIIRKQSFWNTALSYVGVAIGFANKALLYTAVFSKEYYGLLGVLVAIGLIGNSVGQLGVGAVAVRFMPYIRDHAERWRKFNGLLLIWMLTGVMLVTSILLVAHPLITSFYVDKSSLIVDYYSYAVVLFFMLAGSQFTTALCYAHLKTVLPAFMRDVGIKLWQTLIGLGYWAALYEFDVFLGLYVAGWGIWTIVLTLYLIATKRFPVKIDFKFFRTRIGRLSLNYGLFTSLNQSSAIFVKHLDKLMIPALVVVGAGLLSTGLDASANYELGFFMATVIVMPYRALGPISFGVVARSFREGNMANIEMVYKKSSLNGLIVGLAAFFLIFINLDSFFILRPEFEGARWVFFFLGLSYLFDIANGVNGYIMIASKYFRVDLWINLFLIVIVFASNYWLIPIHGEVGAALATAGSVFIFNILRGMFLWSKFRIQPFSLQTLYLLFFAAVALLLGMYIPTPAWLAQYNDYIRAVAEVALRSIPVALLYGGLLVGFRISPDLNELLFQFMGKIGLKK
jgi:O-antigen/teichoic acid export membrane protein